MNIYKVKVKFNHLIEDNQYDVQWFIIPIYSDESIHDAIDALYGNFDTDVLSYSVEYLGNDYLTIPQEVYDMID